MQYISANALPLVNEEDALPEVLAIYDEMKRVMQMPYVPNMTKAIGGSPAALAMHWGINRGAFENTTLPAALVSMILYTIAEKSYCEYCGAAHEVTCRSLGVDEDTLARLVKDLGNVNPRRIRAIIEFALKVAKDPQGMDREDYDEVRAQGISDEEIVEIIVLSGIAVYLDIVADALKVEVDPQITEALGR